MGGGRESSEIINAESSNCKNLKNFTKESAQYDELIKLAESIKSKNLAQCEESKKAQDFVDSTPHFFIFSNDIDFVKNHFVGLMGLDSADSTNSQDSINPQDSTSPKDSTNLSISKSPKDSQDSTNSHEKSAESTPNNAPNHTQNYTPNYTIVDINSASNAAFELTLMSACKHQIIANSTFSTWASYINPNPNKIIIAPDIFAYGRDIETFPLDFFRIDHIWGLMQ
ncbi:hypothetical protein CCY99_07445 [Helicobacter sp. 16-1353]|uniref:alpha-1,2-fucosyltransferase n=1 Tax=Helicobacter sp. 16-1353 TaxID=2004996 RepID=UPI000DCE11A0|nr:alpha-1,2-fucosyltransferase [Helicobacter sp. 16-1353]RAX52472.1 hypothetical protein CCY99_07445 [Helicobacter sp. 16-1353]